MKFTPRLLFSLVAIGIIAGLAGIGLSWLLHFIQHHAYGYGLTGAGEIPFRLGVEHAPPWRRVAALALCGLLVGVGWYLIKRRGAPLVSIKAALDKPRQGLPFLTTVCHSLLQIVTVGLGSPMGREVAPREMSAAFASAWVRRLGMSETEARLLIACASGAGLAAVYNVPLAAAVFTLETLLCVWSPTAVAAALLTSVVATAVSRWGMGDLVQYHLIDASVNTALIGWALLMGPLIGAVVALFRKTVAPLPLMRRDDPKIILVAVAAFLLIGLLAVYFPAVLGNGKAGNQLGFAGLLDGQSSLTLFAVKWLVVLLALAAGAYGGLITPSMMLGGMLALACAFGWNHMLPPLSVEAAALVGAAAFLAVSQKMPLTALVFVLELTRVSGAFLMPMAVCVTGALLANRWLTHKQTAA
ncbi:chloride channel protein [Uruburuella testudinis]|uniref:Chloride channel protein n=1 Tax=Uruburuella testudinis TaxID=1282863 RepID=A0ABY4DU49_9NEIS|nr:chloride channel protein [Uruburuella testudinis]UOO82200.1 chloride channel protein [Uruburuella testudinis]